MKKTKHLILMALAMLTMLVPQEAWAWGGSGTSSSPYTISNADDLKKFANIVNGANGQTRNVAACGKLTADITLSGNWTAIGTSSYAYTGTFDGQGHKISGMNISGYNKTYQGFFGYVNDATIQNFSLEGSMSSSTQFTGDNDASGTVVGRANGSTKILNVVSSVNLTISTNKQNHIGGIVGYIAGSTQVSGCTYSGTLDAGPSADSNGGIVGFAYASCSGSITYCFFNGTIKTSGSNPQMGGILGYTNDTSNNFGGVQNCYSCGTLTFSGKDTYANAIVGRIRAKSHTTINNTFLSGTATRACNEDCDEKVDFTKNKAISISVTAGSNGTVSQSYVNPTSTTATQLQVVATPNAHYHFGSWSDSGAQTHNVGLTANVSLSASFAIDQHNITVAANNSNYGTVSGGGTFNYGATKTITATPKTGYHFVQWNDGNKNASRTITVTENKTYTATFAAHTYGNAAWTWTGTSAASAKITCTACGNVLSGNATITSKVKTAATCTAKGTTTYTAKVTLNNKEYTATKDVVDIAALGHNFTSKTATNTYLKSAATCTEDAVYYHKCSRCTEKGSTTWTKTGTKLGHDFTVQSTDDAYLKSAATCTEDAVYYHKCSRCAEKGSTTWTNTGTKLGHSLNDQSQCTRSGCNHQAKAVYNEGTLTFYFDDADHTGTTYSLNIGINQPNWVFSNRKSITTVVFDQSFAAARPTSCYFWFDWCENLTSISGLEYLNTEEVSNMENMFFVCCKLEELTIGNFNMRKVMNMRDMFYSCPALNTLTMKSLPYLAEGTFDTQFTGAGKVVNLILDENSVIYEGDDNHLPAITNCNHYNQTTSVHVDATCTKEGYDGYFCSYCKGHFDKTNIVSALGHHLDANGICSVCHYGMVGETIPCTATAGSDGYEGETYDKAFDGTTSTKWCHNTTNPWVEFQTAWSVIVTGYKLSTANDTESDPSRNPKNWVLKGWSEEKQAWSVLDTKSNDNTLQAMNETEYNFELAEPGKVTYQRFRMEFTHSGLMQLSEISITGVDPSTWCEHEMTHHPAVAETCTTDGYKEYWTCSKPCCVNKYFKDEDGTEKWTSYPTIAACHDFTQKKAEDEFLCSAATCINQARYYFSCSRCGVNEHDDNHTFAYGELAEHQLDDDGACTLCKFGHLMAKAVLADSILTFYFDKLEHDGKTYSLNTSYKLPDWYSERHSITSVVFDTSFVAVRPTSCYYWFYDCINLTNIFGLEYLNTEEVTVMNSMFGYCNELTSLDISSFNTKSVTSMTRMFYSCDKLKKLTIGNFDMQSVNSFGDMFSFCKALDTLTMKSLPYLAEGTFDTKFTGAGKVVNLILDENSVIYEGTNYLPTITNCNHYNQTTPVHVDATCTEDGYDYKTCSYCHTVFDKTINGSALGHDISNNQCSRCDLKAKAVYADDTLTFYFDDVEHSGTTYSLNAAGSNPEWYTSRRRAITDVVFDVSFAAALPTSCYKWFAGSDNLRSITGIEHLNTQEVTDMRFMFSYCSSLQSLNLRSFHTEKVTSMYSMFSNCNSLTSLDLSNFNTENVENMQYLFDQCRNLKELTIGNNFTIKQETNTYGMWSFCDALNTLNLKSLPYLDKGTFDDQFSGEGKVVNYELDDNSVIYAGENHLPEATSVNYTRALTEGKTVTFMLPFDVPVENINGTVYKLSGFDGQTLSFSQPADGIAHANTPYLLTEPEEGNLLKEAIGSWAFDIEDSTYTQTVGNSNASMWGTYTKQTGIFSTDDESIYGYAGGEFVRQQSEAEGASKGATLKPFRALIKVCELENGAPAARLALALDEETVGVISISDDELNARPVNVYDMNGRLVRANVDPMTCLKGLPKGMYVVKTLSH